MGKNVLIINSSPRQNGNTYALSEAFKNGIIDGGGSAEKYDIHKMNIHRCLGCFACQMGKGSPCVQKDDMQKIYDHWSNADIIVFATPVYWMDFNGEFALFRDRLFATTMLKSKPKKLVLLASATTPETDIYPIFIQRYEYMLGVLKYEDGGRILAGGCANPGDVFKTDYITKTYDLGKRLRQ